MGRSGLETRLQNSVFHLLRTKRPEEWVASIARTKKEEPLAYMVKVQVSSRCGEAADIGAKIVIDRGKFESD